MIRRTFLAIVGGMFCFFKKPSTPIVENGPNFGLYCTFECYDCGRRYGCNNISSCYGCGKSHFKVVAVHFENGVAIYTNPPKPNCTMAYGAMIILPDAFANLSVKNALWDTGMAFIRGNGLLGNPRRKS